MNRVTLIGNIGQPVQVQRTAKGVPHAYVSLGVEGSKPDKMDWVQCIAWGGVAESLAARTHVGDLVRIEGSVANSIYKDDDDREERRMRVKVSRYKIERKGRASMAKIMPTLPEPWTGIEDSTEATDLPF